MKDLLKYVRNKNWKNFVDKDLKQDTLTPARTLNFLMDKLLLDDDSITDSLVNFPIMKLDFGNLRKLPNSESFPETSIEEPNKVVRKTQPSKRQGLTTPSLAPSLYIF